MNEIANSANSSGYSEVVPAWLSSQLYFKETNKKGPGDAGAF